MVPKFTNSEQIPKMVDDEYEVVGGSDVDIEDEDDESDEDPGDFDAGDDFLNALNHADVGKRKLEEDEDEKSDEKNDTTEADGQEPPKKKKKKKKNADVNMKPPTAEEMTRLRETENLFHSNLFRMQIEEMVKEVRPKKVERKQIKPWLEKFKEFLLNIDDSSKIKLKKMSAVEDIKPPIPRMPHEITKVTSFLRPSSVSVIGSYDAGCCMGPSLSVDVVVVIPKKCFLKEDYLNGRYHVRRAVYLSVLARALSSCELVDKGQGVRWGLAGGSPLTPQLIVNPADKLSKVQVCVSAVPHPAAFRMTRFTPAKNNVRESWLTEGKAEDCRTPTPLYNTSVMRDLVLTANEAVRTQVLENNNNFKDAILLLRVWLRQRQLDLGAGGFSGYLVSMLVVSLLRSHWLNSLMSSYQVVRNVWLTLSQSDWTKEGLSMSSSKADSNVPSLQDFHSHFDVVFVDTTGYCNLAAGVHRLTYLKVKHEAELAVKCLDNPDMNSFQALFMTPMPFLHQYDHVLCMKKTKKIKASILSEHCSQEEITDNFANLDMLLVNVVGSLLERGLGGRVDQLMFKLPQEPQWPVTERWPKAEQTLLIGLRLNTEAAYSVLEKGPPANEPQAAEFRTLWGKHSELRRFRDGTVCEAVVWAEPESPLATRRLITRQMVLTLFQERLNIPANAVTYLADQLEPLVTETAFVLEGFQYGSGEEASHAVIQAYDRLAKQLRELPDLPLDIASVHGISAVFRGAEVFPPLARSAMPLAKTTMQGKTCWLLSDTVTKAPDYVAPVEVVMQLGLSRKWPEDVDAVRRLRAAFHLHVAKAVLTQYDLQAQAFPDHVDVFKDGFVFRVSIVYPGEVALLKKVTTPDGKLLYRDTPQSVHLDRLSSHLPKLTGALHGLQQQWPAFSVACRLAKRWLSAQLVDEALLPGVATELLVASLFLSPEPFRPLSQPQAMFLRFLHLLASANWQLEPVIVNFNSDLKRDDLVEIESQFRSERSSLPPLVIVTQYDRSGAAWTREAPLLPVLVRVANMARESLTLLENNFLGAALLDNCKVVFRPPLELYDTLIRLKPMLLPRIVHGVDYGVSSPRELKVPQVRQKIPITGFDPAQCYLQELRENYDEYALFFHDTYGGNTIGVLFKPRAFENQEFKVSHVNCRKSVTVNKKSVLQLNLDAIIEDFYILGTGLVRTIDLSPKYSQKL